MQDGQNHNSKKRFGFLRRGASGLTLGLGSSALILVVTTAIALVAIATTAWLASNRDVDSGSMAMDMDKDMFELAVVTEEKTVNSTLVKVRKDSVPESALNAFPTARYDKDRLETAEGIGVICALKTNNGKPLRPGYSGTLTFRVLAKQDLNCILASLSLTGFKRVVDKSDPNNIKVSFELIDENAEADKQAAVGYLASHILFYPTEERNAADRIGPGETFAITAYDEDGEQNVRMNKKGDYTVTLYWTWPRTYDDFLRQLGVPDVPEVGSSLTGEELAAAIAAREAAITARADAITENQTLISAALYLNETEDTGYNDADQQIGAHIYYAVTELTAQVGEAGNGMISVHAIENS